MPYLGGLLGIGGLYLLSNAAWSYWWVPLLLDPTISIDLPYGAVAFFLGRRDRGQ